MRKTLTVLATAALAASVIAGCGTKEAAPAAPSAAAPSVAAPTLTYGPYLVPPQVPPWEHGPARTATPTTPPGVYEHGPASNTR